MTTGDGRLRYNEMPDDFDYERDIRAPQRQYYRELEMAEIIKLEREIDRRKPGLYGDRASFGRDGTSAPREEPAPPLARVDIARDPIPPRDWAVPERIPARNVALLSGEGAVGKSILLLQLAAATVLARDWIGTMPEPGSVMYLSCEDDDDEVRRRLETIAAHFHATRADMMSGGLHIYDFVGKDAMLGQPDRSDHIRPTPLFEQIKREAVTIRPKLILIDTVADTFAGRENDRAQTRQFITLARNLAIESNSSVVLASHPSLTGIATDSGLSGSTAWHNSVRARGYMKKADGVDDDDLRLLEWRKNNYGRKAETIVLRWRDGIYVPEPQAGSLEKMAADQKVDDFFLDLLRRFTKQGRNVTDRRGPSYAPAKFAEQPEAQAMKATSKVLSAAMERLLAAGKIQVLTEGSPSHPRTRMVEAQGPSN